MKRNHVLVGAVLILLLGVSGAVVANRILGKTPAPQTQESAPMISRVAVTAIPERDVPGRGKAAFEIEIIGDRFFGTAFGPYVRLNGADAVAVILDSQQKITALAPPGLTGNVEIVVENPDHQIAKTTAVVR